MTLANITHLVEWFQDEAAEGAFEVAAATGKPLFVDLYAVGCKGCEKLDVTTYQEREVADLLNERFVPVLLNGRMPSPALSKVNGSHAYIFSPVLIQITPEGRELRRTVGYLSPESMLVELKLGLAISLMHELRWTQASRLLEEVAAQFGNSRLIPEVLWWRGVALYRQSGNDVKTLREAWAPLIDKYPTSLWSEKANVLDPVCLC